MSRIVNGRALAARIEKKIKRRVARLKKQGLKPTLAVVLVGAHSPSLIYIKRKQEACRRTGLGFVLKKFPAGIRQSELIKNLKRLQKDNRAAGLIVQLPLPPRLNTDRVLEAIDPALDVDCLTRANLAKIGQADAWPPPTPAAILEILRSLKINLKNKKIVLMGYGRLVGKPLASWLKKMNIKVTVCQQRTKSVKKKCLAADIIITAVGKRNLLTGEMVKPGAAVIDAGIVFENRRLYGDVDFAGVRKKAGWLTPVPGGVGPVTVAKLLENVARHSEQRLKKQRPAV